MSDDKQKNLEILQKVLEEGDKWLLDHGVVSDLTHNAIVTGIYANYPVVQYVDYYMDKDQKVIDLNLYIGFWRLLWLTLTRRRDALLDDVFFALSDYLKDFQVRVNLKRYKRQDQKS
jgi:hypothetical protein